MKQITIKLTEDQANQMAYWLSYETGWIQNNDFPRSDENNAFIERIHTKVVKALGIARHQGSADRINKILAKAKTQHNS